MKKLALATLALTCAASVFAQGTVNFYNRVTGTTNGPVTFVYLGGNSQRVGNGTADTPTGNTDWTGFTRIAGGSFFAQLLAANGANQPENSLTPQGATTTFRTGTASGNVAASTATLGNVPKDAAFATLQMVAWDNSSGLYSTWAQASVAFNAGLIAAGRSNPFTLSAIGGDFNTPPNLVGLQSFNIYLVPEPSTFALAGLGAAALLIFRRRK
jgi:hypothetical protein